AWRPKTCRPRSSIRPRTRLPRTKLPWRTTRPEAGGLRRDPYGIACVVLALPTGVRLSVLDLVPVRTDQSTSDAIAASLSLAECADNLGFTRYWLAEHHNMPAVGATSPPVLIAFV